MENLEIFKIVGIVIVAFFLLKFIWGMLKGVFKIVLTIIVVAVGLYFMKPELLHNAFGKENVEIVAKKVNDGGNELIEAGSKEFDKVKKNTLDSVTQ